MPSSTLGKVPAGSHHSAMKAPAGFSNHLRRCDMTCRWSER